jgi:hypothetical protein
MIDPNRLHGEGLPRCGRSIIVTCRSIRVVRREQPWWAQRSNRALLPEFERDQFELFISHLTGLAIGHWVRGRFESWTAPDLIRDFDLYPSMTSDDLCASPDIACPRASAPPRGLSSWGAGAL